MRLDAGRVTPLFLVLTALVASSAPAQERIGFSLEPWLERSQMSGRQSIDNAVFDQTFDYGSAGVSASLFMLFHAKERFRAGPALRVYGNYRALADSDFHFGFLTEALFLGEYAIPKVVEKFDAIIGFRAGVPVLFPGGDLRAEIDRLRADDVDVWAVPRVGALLGGTVGTRRQMTEKLALRADLTGQYEQLWLFATSQTIDDLRFRKSWRTHSVRIGLQLAVELGL